MSKMDALRAMREARYEEMTKRAGAGSAATPARKRTAARPPVAPPVQTPVESPRDAGAGPAADPALCGHRNMSGRTCTRESGHAAKNHRYS